MKVLYVNERELSMTGQITARYHFSETGHIAFSLPLYVSSGSCGDNYRASPGQNLYPFMPTVTFARLDGKGDVFSLGSALRNAALWPSGYGWIAGWPESRSVREQVDLDAMC